jgi:hypothetical protein
VSRLTPPYHVALLLLLVACFEPPLEHTSPFDPASGFSLTIRDLPDSVFLREAELRGRLESEPVLEREHPIVWSVNHAALVSIGGGRFSVRQSSAIPRTVHVTAALGAYRATRDIVLMQKVDTLSVTCAVQGCGTLVSLWTHTAFRVRAIDALGAPVDQYRHALVARGTLGLRDTTLFEQGNATDSIHNFVSRANGVTWFVVAADGRRDSIRVEVRQYAQTWPLLCNGALWVGGSDQLRSATPRDPRGYDLDIVPPELRWTPGEEVPIEPWAPLIGASATVTPDGAITAHAAGMWRTEAYVPEQGGRVVGECRIMLQGP